MGDLLLHKKEYRGLIKFIDGHEKETSVPCVIDENGRLLVPGSITVGNNFFKLKKSKTLGEYLVYLEEKKPSIPFSINLH